MKTNQIKVSQLKAINKMRGRNGLRSLPKGSVVEIYQTRAVVRNKYSNRL